jgi:hypothetical protein
MMAKESAIPKIIEGQCPSCGYVGIFHHIGNQKWPQEVAERMGVDKSVELYQCAHCLTTISEPMLRDAE